MDKIKDFFSNLSSHDLPSGAAALVGIFLLILIFWTSKKLMKLMCFIVAVALFLGAYWWHQHKG